ncbi:MAG: hypothetical protein DI586_03190 [Micavibrio aeruginosavorus]|uniref:Lipoprotein n=1 Tax=Micavibrio aeruginosavorus TaxID=349221 RepID=A0A2W5HEM7_9BACT|nr:MAG: hypothetical protein DI586_03190 [Micavibrio aeruginosavorus]
MIRRLSFPLLAVLLTSCGVIPTQYMPNGYRYNDDTPLSSPAPSRPWLDEAEDPSIENLADNTAAWQGAVYELINQLPAALPPSSGPVTLATTPPAYIGDKPFDHYLRQGLISYGYRVNPTVYDAGTIIVYNATPITNKDALKKAQAKYGKEAINPKNTKGVYYLTLEIKSADGKKTMFEQSSLAVIPHDKTEYMRMPGLSYTPSQNPPAEKKPVYEVRE